MVFQIEHYDLINLYFANVLNIICGTRPHIIQCRIYIQSCVKTLLLGFGNGWLKYNAILHFWDGQQNIFRAIIRT